MQEQSTKVTSGGWDFRLHPASSKVGVVLVHEIFGFDQYADSVAAQLAQTGFSVAAVDLYRGKLVSSLEEGFKLRSALKEQEVLDALGSGLQLLVQKIGQDAKVGSMGFCMGGAFALLGACNLNMAFCVDYYGMIENVEQVKGAKGPVQLMLASEDERVTPWAYQHFLPAATKYKKRVDVHLYPNAQHAFHRPNWEGHNAEAAKDAWGKTLTFISQFRG
ncbi:MAG: dienelactone hydrolase family protein [Candidatus Bathyarchaeia archaeon]